MKKYLCLILFIISLIITPTVVSLWVVNDVESNISIGKKNNEGLKNYIDDNTVIFDYTQHKPKIEILNETPTFSYYYLSNDKYNEVTDSDLINAGTYKLKVSNDTYGETTFDYTINARDITECNILFNNKSINETLSFTYQDEISTNITYNSNTLILNTDYTITYYDSNNQEITPSDVGTYTATITGINNFTGSCNVQFTINSYDVKTNTTITLDKTSYVYTGSEIKPTVNVLVNGNKIDESNYTITYSNNINVGTATITIKGKGNYTGEISTTFTIINKKLDIKMTGNSEFTYDGNTRVPDTDTYQVYYKDESGNVEYIENATVEFTYGNNSTPKDAGSYEFNSATISAEGYSTTEVNISYTGYKLIINKYELSVSWTTSSYTYNGTLQAPTPSISGAINDEVKVSVGGNKDAGKYTAKAYLEDNTSESKVKNYSLTNSTCTYTISKQKLYITTELVELSYDSSKRTFSSLKSDIINNIKFNGLISGDDAKLSIDELNDGTFQYTSDNVGFVTSDNSLQRTGLTTSYSYLIGSTYQIKMSIANTNYNLVYYNNCILKYKTAKIGSTYYTIEDALNTSGNITFAGNASNTEFVYTAFSNLYGLKICPYKTTTYELTGSRQLIVPYKDSTETFDSTTSTTYSYNVYSALYVNKNITINVSSSAHIDISALIGASSGAPATITEDHGVLINEGTINFESGTTLNSYGYTKGIGTINMKNGSIAQGVFHQYDWPGGSVASEIYNNVLLTNAWSINNISCNMYVYSGAKYQTYFYIWMTKGITSAGEATPLIIGDTSSTNCLFKPKEVSDNAYVLFNTINARNTGSGYNQDALYKVEGSNQTKGQRTEISFGGSYIDATFSISVKLMVIFDIKFSTSTSLALTVGFADIILLEGADVSLSKASYLFLPGSKLEVQEGAKLTINSGVNVTFAKYASLPSGTKAYQNYIVDKDDSYCINNGEITSYGNMGGFIKTTVDNATLTSSSVETTYTIFYTTTDPYYTSISSNLLTGVDGSSGNFKAGSNYVSTNGSWIEGEAKEFTLNYYDSNTLLYTLVVKQPNSDTYTITGSEYTGSKKYYDFVKWTLDSGSDISSTTISAGGSINLYAVWTEHEYTISYTTKYNDEAVEAINNNKKTFTISDLEFTLEDASYNSKYFDGWYVGIDKSSGLKINKMTKSYLDAFIEKYGENQTIPLYAEFTDENQYTIAFEKSTESSGYDDYNAIDPNIDNIYVLEGNSITITLTDSQLSNLTQYDNDSSMMYYFNGWKVKDETTVYKNGETITVTKDIVLVPNWEKKLSITYNYGTDLNVTLGTYSSKSTTTYYYVYGSDAKIFIDPSDKGHTFVNWSNGSSTYVEITTSTFSSDVTLTANYTVNTYTLTISGTGNQTVTVKINGKQIASSTSINMTYDYSYGDKISISFDKRSGNIFNYKYTSITLTAGSETIATHKNGSSSVNVSYYLDHDSNYTLTISK